MQSSFGPFLGLNVMDALGGLINPAPDFGHGSYGDGTTRPETPYVVTETNGTTSTTTTYGGSAPIA